MHNYANSIEEYNDLMDQVETARDHLDRFLMNNTRREYRNLITGGHRMSIRRISDIYTDVNGEEILRLDLFEAGDPYWTDTSEIPLSLLGLSRDEVETWARREHAHAIRLHTEDCQREQWKQNNQERADWERLNKKFGKENA